MPRERVRAVEIGSYPHTGIREDISLNLEAIADLAMERKVGARGLRMILEDLMLDLMYYLPSYKKVREFQVTKEMVLSQKISLTILEKAG